MGSRTVGLRRRGGTMSDRSKQEMPKEMVDMLKKRRTLKGSWWHMASKDWKFEVWSCKCHEAYHWWHWEEQFRVSLFSRTHAYACIDLLDFTISRGRSQSFRATRESTAILLFTFNVPHTCARMLSKSSRFMWSQWWGAYDDGVIDPRDTRKAPGR